MKRIVLVLMTVLLTSNVFAQRTHTRYSNISKSRVNLKSFKRPPLFNFGTEDEQSKNTQDQRSTYNFQSTYGEVTGFQLVSLNLCHEGEEVKCHSLDGAFEQSYTNDNTVQVTIDYKAEICVVQEDGKQAFFQFIFSDDQNSSYQPLIYNICD